MSTTAHHCASDSSQNGALVTIAALFTRTSSLPNSRLDGGDGVRDRRGVAHVGDDRQRPPARRGDRGDHGVELGAGAERSRRARRGRGRCRGRRRPRPPRRARGVRAALPAGGAGDQRDLAGEVGVRPRPRSRATPPRNCPEPPDESGEPLSTEPRLGCTTVGGRRLKPLSDGSVGIAENSDGAIDRPERWLSVSEAGRALGLEPHEPARRGGRGPARVGAHARRASPVPARRAAPLPARGRGGPEAAEAPVGAADAVPTRLAARSTRLRHAASPSTPPRSGSRARPGHGAARRPSDPWRGRSRRMRRASTCSRTARCASARRPGCRGGSPSGWRRPTSPRPSRRLATSAPAAVRPAAAAFPEPRSTGQGVAAALRVTASRRSACSSSSSPPRPRRRPPSCAPSTRSPSCSPSPCADRSRIAELERRWPRSRPTAACETDAAASRSERGRVCSSSSSGRPRREHERRQVGARGAPRSRSSRSVSSSSSTSTCAAGGTVGGTPRPLAATTASTAAPKPCSRSVVAYSGPMLVR